MSEVDTGSTSKSSTSLLTAGAVGAVVGAAVVGAALGFGILLAGDEPPIRVKNGSIDIELLHNTKEWKEDGSRSKWKISKGTRGSEDYEVFVAPTDSASCPNGVNAVGREVRITHSDNTWIDFRAPGKKTRVEVSPGKELSKSPDGRTLTYTSAGGRIASIRVGTNTLCTFSTTDQQLAVVLIDR